MSTVASVIYVALAEAALIALLIWNSARERTAHDKAVLDILASTETERAELLNRIQRPEMVPVRPGLTKQPPPPKDAANLAKIGTVAVPGADDGR